LPDTRTCDKCNFKLPLTASHFDRKRDAPDGFRTTCKTCRKEMRDADNTPRSGQQNVGAGVEEIANSLDGAALSLLRKLSTDNRQSTDVPHEAEVYQEIMARFGGASGFADHLMAQFLASGPGSSSRLSILRMVTQMSANVVKSGYATVPLEMLSDEDLARLHAKQAQAILASQPSPPLPLLPAKEATHDSATAPASDQ
jgi:hypothetical protein